MEKVKTREQLIDEMNLDEFVTHCVGSEPRERVGEDPKVYWGDAYLPEFNAEKEYIESLGLDVAKELAKKGSLHMDNDVFKAIRKKHYNLIPNSRII